jgi:Xaa-Pro aminopeptidase
MNQQRKLIVDKILQSNSVSAVIFWRPEELVMMLGYYPLWGLSFLVYTNDSKPVLFVPQAEPGDILPDEIEVRRFPWGQLSNINPWDVLFNEIKSLLRERKILNSNFSFISESSAVSPCRMSGESPHLPGDLMTRLLQLSESAFKNIDEELLQLLQYKTDDDIVCIKQAQKVAAKAVNVFYEHALPGISEAKLASLIEGAVSMAMEEDGVFFARAWPMVQSGINAADGGLFNRTTFKQLKRGELVMLEMAVCVNGYWVDITRTAKVSVMSAKQNELYELVSKAQQLAIQQTAPGKAMSAIDAVARTCIKEAGYDEYFNHALGHQVGFRYHDPGPGLSPYSDGTLKEGMVLTVEPGIYGAALGAGVRIEDNVLVTQKGFEILSAY